MRFRASVLALLTVGSFACAQHIAPRPERAVSLPNVDARSVTDANHAAVIGTVRDSSTGRPLHALAILFVRYDSTKIQSITDSAGGFVLPLIAPGHYSLVVRAVGYVQQLSEHVLIAGAIDTVRVRLPLDPVRLLEITPSNLFTKATEAFRHATRLALRDRKIVPEVTETGRQ